MKYSLIAFIALGISACASVNQFHGTPKQRYTANLLTEYEISRSYISFGSRTAYDVIKSLRPAFLNSRGCRAGYNASNAEPVVFLDGLRLSGTGSLYRISADNIAEIRYLTPLEATTRYGATNPCGVLAILSKTN